MEKNSNEQKLIDLTFSIAIASGLFMNNRSAEEIAEWTAKMLRESGFNTAPAGLSWGVLC